MSLNPGAEWYALPTLLFLRTAFGESACPLLEDLLAVVPSERYEHSRVKIKDEKFKRYAFEAKSLQVRRTTYAG